MAQSADVRMELTAESLRSLELMRKFDAVPRFRKAMMEATQPLAPAVKRVVRSLPSKDVRTKDSLRTAVANVVTRKLKVTTRALLVIITAIPKGGKSNLGRVFEGELKPWLHPTFGHDPVVDQTPEPFFYDTLDKYEPAIAARILAAMAELERELG